MALNGCKTVKLYWNIHEILDHIIVQHFIGCAEFDQLNCRELPILIASFKNISYVDVRVDIHGRSNIRMTQDALDGFHGNSSVIERRCVSVTKNVWRSTMNIYLLFDTTPLLIEGAL